MAGRKPFVARSEMPPSRPGAAESVLTLENQAGSYGGIGSRMVFVCCAREAFGALVRHFAMCVGSERIDMSTGPRRPLEGP